MRVEQATADVKLEFKGRSIGLKALVDTGASRSVISKRLAEELGALIPLDEPYELRIAYKYGKLRMVEQSLVKVAFRDVEVPGRVVFEVAEKLGEMYL
ncbi:MAG: retroviral-like aspartic protease family protein [Candidatus Bathyarchaeia archaeon]